MKTQIIKILFVTAAFFFISSINSVNGQDKTDKPKHEHKMKKGNEEHGMMKGEMHEHMHGDSTKKQKDNKMMEHSKMNDQTESIIREGVIDLKAIDKNNDRKVFQDQMDWNVISDEPGKCPICEMELKEVPINMAKAKLLEHGFKVK